MPHHGLAPTRVATSSLRVGKKEALGFVSDQVISLDGPALEEGWWLCRRCKAFVHESRFGPPFWDVIQRLPRNRPEAPRGPRRP